LLLLRILPLDYSKWQKAKINKVLANFTRYEPAIIRHIYGIGTGNNLLGPGSPFYPSKFWFGR